MLPETCVTFFPAEPGIPQYPIFMVIKMDFPVGWEEGMGKFPCCSIKAVVNKRLQAVRVIDRVEACEKSNRFSVSNRVKPSRTQTAVNLWFKKKKKSLMVSHVFSNLQSHKRKNKCKAIVRNDGCGANYTQPCDDPGFRAVSNRHK